MSACDVLGLIQLAEGIICEELFRKKELSRLF